MGTNIFSPLQNNVGALQSQQNNDMEPKKTFQKENIIFVPNISKIVYTMLKVVWQQYKYDQQIQFNCTRNHHIQLQLQLSMMQDDYLYLHTIYIYTCWDYRICGSFAGVLFVGYQLCCPIQSSINNSWVQPKFQNILLNVLFRSIFIKNVSGWCSTVQCCCY